MKPKLTIAIPTYNHHVYLKRQLISLLPQITEEIELFIIDNNSNPAVKLYLANEGIDTTYITIIENNQNIGGDANILKCLSLSNAKWVWVLSDNDIILKNAVSNILNSIINNYSCVFISLGNDKNEKIFGLEEFFRKLNYENSFTVSNSLYNMEKLYDYLYFYEKSISTHQGQILFVIKYFEINKDAKAIQLKTKIFDESLPATWPKLAFIKDSMYISNFIGEENIRLYNRTIGIKIWCMLIRHSIIGRCYEMMSVKDYLIIYVKLFYQHNIHLIFKSHFWKLNTLYWISLFSKKFYPRYREKNNLFQYEYSSKSKASTWGIH